MKMPQRPPDPFAITKELVDNERHLTDLLELSRHGLLEQRKKGRGFTFIPPSDLADRLRKLEKA